MGASDFDDSIALLYRKLSGTSIGNAIDLTDDSDSAAEPPSHPNLKRSISADANLATPLKRSESVLPDTPLATVVDIDPEIIPYIEGVPTVLIKQKSRMTTNHPLAKQFIHPKIWIRTLDGVFKGRGIRFTISQYEKLWVYRVKKVNIETELNLNDLRDQNPVGLTKKELLELAAQELSKIALTIHEVEIVTAATRRKQQETRLQQKIDTAISTGDIKKSGNLIARGRKRRYNIAIHPDTIIQHTREPPEEDERNVKRQKNSAGKFDSALPISKSESTSLADISSARDDQPIPKQSKDIYEPLQHFLNDSDRNNYPPPPALRHSRDVYSPPPTFPNRERNTSPRSRQNHTLQHHVLIPEPYATREESASVGETAEKLPSDRSDEGRREQAPGRIISNNQPCIFPLTVPVPTGPRIILNAGSGQYRHRDGRYRTTGYVGYVHTERPDLLQHMNESLYNTLPAEEYSRKDA